MIPSGRQIFEAETAIYGCHFLIARIHKSGNQGVRVALLTNRPKVH